MRGCGEVTSKDRLTVGRLVCHAMPGFRTVRVNPGGLVPVCQCEGSALSQFRGAARCGSIASSFSGHLHHAPPLVYAAAAGGDMRPRRKPQKEQPIFYCSNPYCFNPYYFNPLR